MFDEKKVFDWIVGLNMPGAHGNREMPIWGDWLMDEAVEDSTSHEAADAAAKQVEQRVIRLCITSKAYSSPDQCAGLGKPERANWTSAIQTKQRDLGSLLAWMNKAQLRSRVASLFEALRSLIYIKVLAPLLRLIVS